MNHRLHNFLTFLIDRLKITSEITPDKHKVVYAGRWKHSHHRGHLAKKKLHKHLHTVTSAHISDSHADVSLLENGYLLYAQAKSTLSEPERTFSLLQLRQSNLLNEQNQKYNPLFCFLRKSSALSKVCICGPNTSETSHEN